MKSKVAAPKLTKPKIEGIIAACHVALAAYDAAEGSGDVGHDDARRIRNALDWAKKVRDHVPSCVNCYWLPALALTLTACSGSVFISVEGGIAFEGGIVIGHDAGPDAESDGGDLSDARDAADATPSDAADAADTSDACPTVYGATGCDAIMAKFCSALYACNGGMTVQQCKTWWATNYPADFDCSAAKYKKNVCDGNSVNACVNTEIPAHSCGTLMSSTPKQLAGACGFFFGEF